MQKCDYKNLIGEILLLVPGWRLVVTLNTLLAHREHNKALTLYAISEDPLVEFESRMLAFVFKDPSMLWINVFGLLFWSLIALGIFFLIIPIFRLNSMKDDLTPQRSWQRIVIVVTAILASALFRGFPITLWHSVSDHSMPNGAWRFASLFGFIVVGSTIIFLADYLSRLFFHRISSQHAS